MGCASLFVSRLIYTVARLNRRRWGFGGLGARLGRGFRRGWTGLRRGWDWGLASLTRRRRARFSPARFSRDMIELAQLGKFTDQ